MSEAHPEETELARLSDGGSGASVAQHVSWCARCRNVVADYRWLQEGIADTLATAADRVAVPRPQWWAVQEALSTGRRRQVMEGRVSAVASVVLAVCLMLSLSPVLGTAGIVQGAHTSLPQVVVAPAPVTVAVSGEHSGGCGASMETPTPVVFYEGDATLVPTPAFMLPPTPPGGG